MQKAVAGALALSFVIFAGLTPTAEAQSTPTPQPPEYGARFFSELRSLFGRFSDTDLSRAFRAADAIRCAELVGGKGEWHQVAFFNENRDLGSWYRSTIEEVRGDLAAYIFEGLCRGERGAVQLRTKFPVSESLDALAARRIDLSDVVVNVNAPVSAVFESRSESYVFDLPYLYRIAQQDATVRYSLNAPRISERRRYATDVVNHWECKAVRAEVTYRFLICRMSIIADRQDRTTNRNPSFGSSAFAILSDGGEASTTVKMTFGGAAADEPVEERVAAPLESAWQSPASTGTLASLAEDEFRIRFRTESWNGRLSSGAVLSDGKLSAGSPTPAQRASDHCVWSPSASSLINRLLASEPEDVAYSLRTLADGSVALEMKTFTGQRLGVFQCLFSTAKSAAAVSVGRWSAVVGTHLLLETRR